MKQATEKDIGKLCIGRTFNGVLIGLLYHIDNITPPIFIIKAERNMLHPCRYCTPLTQEQIKCLGLEE